MNFLRRPKSYFIVPCVLMGVFLVFELDFAQQRRERETQAAARLAAQKDEQEARRQQRQRDAAEETRRRSEERERSERERLAAKGRDFEALLVELATDTDGRRTLVSQLENEVAAAERELSELRTQTDQTNRETFEFSQRVEHQRIDRRTAELEVQRTTQMVLARLLESSWANGGRPREQIGLP